MHMLTRLCIKVLTKLLLRIYYYYFLALALHFLMCRHIVCLVLL